MILSFIPLWAVLGLAASFINSAIPLIQEKYKAEAYALSYGVKIITALSLLPVIIYQGLHYDYKFYMTASLSALLWCVSDVIYYKAVPKVGAGVVSRLLPSAVIISFILWFFVDTSLIDKYLINPTQSIGLVFIILLASFSASRLKNCATSMEGARAIWFVIFAACVGPLIEKYTLGYSASKQAPFAFVFIQALFMVFFWTIFSFFKKTIQINVLISKNTLTPAILIGLISAIALSMRFSALQMTEHPAYLSVILFTDALWILIYHRIRGIKDNSNIWAGLGIVFCAVALIVVKNL